MSRRCLVHLLSVLCPLLPVAAGCTTSFRTYADDAPLETNDARVGVALDVADAAGLWRADPSRPIAVVSAGPAQIERTARGDAFLVLGRVGRATTRLPMDGMVGSPYRYVFRRRPRNAPDELARVMPAVRGFVAEPAVALPETVAGLLRRAEHPARADVIDLAYYLVRIDPTRLDGSIGPVGRVTGWLRLTPAGRKKLLDALRAAGEKERAPATEPTTRESVK